MDITIADFARKHGVTLPAFESCDVESNRVRNVLQNLFSEPPFTSDLDFVVFGSIARNECTAGSDVDWTLLIDGQADAEHLNTVRYIRRAIADKGLPQPGASGMFGNATISHELIHHIGGQNDTNHNLTKRILLLLESQKINLSDCPASSGTAYDRVISGIIGQYVTHDSGLYSDRQVIPRFLLNDVVRYWRTMCVDFAFKQREDEGKKWAVRNIKLRMSRKLLFVKGLLMCFAHYSAKPEPTALIASLREMALQRPFELLIQLAEKLSIDEKQIVRLLQSYDRFLQSLNDKNIRESLEKTPMKEVYTEEVFLDLRGICDEFQEILDTIFIKGENQLSALTLKYGIF